MLGSLAATARRKEMDGEGVSARVSEIRRMQDALTGSRVGPVQIQFDAARKIKATVSDTFESSDASRTKRRAE